MPSGSASCVRGRDLLVGEGGGQVPAFPVPSEVPGVPLRSLGSCLASTDAPSVLDLLSASSPVSFRSSASPFLFSDLCFRPVFSHCSWLPACSLPICDTSPYISSSFLRSVRSPCASAGSLVTSCQSVPDSVLRSPFVASLSPVSPSPS